MLKKLILTVVFVCSSIAIVSQNKETCDSPDDPIMDLNSITKCLVEDTKDETSKLAARKSKRVSIEVSSRRRVIRRKKKNSASSISVSNKLADLKKNSSLVGKLELSNSQIAEKLPFAFVEEKPSFKSCEDVATVQQSRCFKEEMLKHIKKNFKYPSKSYDASIQGRVLVQFVIDEFGEIKDVITRGPAQGEELENEAKRIIGKLPKLNPGKMSGQRIKVKYGIPITFKIPGKKPSNVRVAKKTKTLSEKELGEVINFSVVENIPMFKSCDKKGDNSVDCFNQEMVKHVQKHFAYPQQAADNDIEGRVFAFFVINKNGEVVNVTTKGPKDGDILELSARKLVQKLPRFVPGKHKGSTANVKYAFPINFKLN